MKRPLSITFKLSGAFVVISILVFSMSWACIHAIRTLDAEVTHMGNVTGEKAILCGRLQGYSGKMRGAVRGILLYTRMEQPDMVARSEREFGEFSDTVQKISTQLVSE